MKGLTPVTQSLVVDESRVIPVPAEEAFHRTLPAPLPSLFKRWHGPIPPIKEVRDQTGDWDAAGQTRVIGWSVVAASRRS